MKRAIAGTLLLTMTGVSAFASGLPRDDASAQRLIQLSTPGSASTGAGFVSDFTVEAGDADSKANLTITRVLSRRAPPGKYFRYQFRASAPFDSKKSESIDVGSLSGLTAGSSVAFEFSAMDWPRADDAFRSMEARCQDAIEALIPGYTWRDTSQTGVVLCTRNGLTMENLNAVVRGLKGLIESCKKNQPNATVCQAFPADRQVPILAATVEQTLESHKSDVDAAVNKSITTISLWTLGAKINQQKFEYVLESAPTDKIKTDERGWSASLAYTQIRHRWLWSAGFSYEESYEGGDETQICTPFGTTGALQCTNAATAAPTRKESELLFAESRMMLRSLNVAVSPRVEFDLDASEWALQLPIYMTRNKEGQFTGGIKLGWKSKDSDFGAAVFVGRSFSFFD